MRLTVDSLWLERGERSIVADLSFTVASGEALILTGANGAGKTTLLRALAGLFAPARGTISLSGQAAESEQTIAERCHFIGHQNGLKSNLTAAENLSFWAAYLGENASSIGGQALSRGDADIERPRGSTSLRDRVEHALSRLDLSALAEIPAGYLSAGQKRRLGLARLLVAERPVWLLDEPTVSLDAASVALLSGVVGTHVAAGGIVVAATHLPLGLVGARELRLGAANGTVATGQAQP